MKSKVMTWRELQDSKENFNFIWEAAFYYFLSKWGKSQRKTFENDKYFYIRDIWFLLFEKNFLNSRNEWEEEVMKSLCEGQEYAFLWESRFEWKIIWRKWKREK